MSKISFNAQALGIALNDKSTNVRHTAAGCAFHPAVVIRPGIEAIIEGLALADIEGFKVPANKSPTRNVDP